MDSGAVLESLKAVDLASLEQLMKICEERARIDQYRARAEEKKSDVAESVFARVMDDYAKRAAALDARSGPLKTQAAQEYRKLKAIFEKIRRDREQAQQQKDEVDFRHSVGELTDAERSDKMAEPQRTLDECEGQQKEVEAVRARFVEAFGGEQALEAELAPAPVATQAPSVAPPTARPVPAPPSPAAVAPPPEPSSAGVAVDEAVTRIANAVRAVSAPALSVAEHIVHPVPRLVPAPPPPVVAPLPHPLPGVKVVESSTDEPDGREGATMMLPTAALVMVEASGSRKEFPLSVFNEIGRAEENRIHVPNPGISRKHAVIKASSGGFVIMDLGSQNGTFVNSERVAERRLANGDTVDLGSVKFVFHTPWPQKNP